jgi:hypothetical protein
MPSDDRGSPRGEPYQTASGVGTFLFCRRAWWSERQRAPSSREPERRLGTAYHRLHAERVGGSRRIEALARAVLVFAILSFLLGLWMVAR